MASPSNEREKLIEALQKADKIAHFRFLDLAPELRNMVYEELFKFYRSRWHSRSICYHASILSTCKQLYYETGGYLNDTNHADIKVVLRERMLRRRDARLPSLQYWQMTRGLDVEVNGINIFASRPATSRDVQIKWPELLRKVDSIAFNIDFTRVYFLRDRDDTIINNVLHALYIHLSQGHLARKLNLHISCAHGIFEDKLAWNALSPICAIAGMIKSSFISTSHLSASLEREIREATVGFRKLYDLRTIVDTAKRLETRPCNKIASEVARYDKLLTPKRMKGSFAFANSERLNLALTRFKRVSEMAATENLVESTD